MKMGKVHINVRCNNPASQYTQFEIRLSGSPLHGLDIQFPAWRPGRYELQNYASLLRGLSIDAHGATLEKRTKDLWRVDELNGVQSLTIRYEFHAARLDAGGSWVDDALMYFNWVNCIPIIKGEGFEKPEITLSIDIPTGFKTSTVLKEAEVGYTASDCEELYESPFMASPQLEVRGYECAGATFSIAIQGRYKPDWEVLIADFKAFTEVQTKLFGGYPASSFLFMILTTSYRHYHGVEHTNCTVITLGPDDKLSDRKFFKELMGVSSHELFHIWNIKRIRPKELLPYRYAQENYFNTGYVAEGFTTYYGDLMLWRSGFFSEQDYLDELNTLLARYFANQGRHAVSLYDSSFDLWMDGYKITAPHRKVSIYVKGALFSFMLDLTIREKSKGAKSLDDLMLALWHNFGQKEIGYTSDDIERLASELCSESLDDFFTKYLKDVTPIEEELGRLVDWLGWELKLEDAANAWEHRLGVRLAPQNAEADKLTIVDIDITSDAYAHLMIGDEVLSKPEELEEACVAGADSIKLEIERSGLSKSISVSLGVGYLKKAGLRAIPQPDASHLKHKSEFTWQ